MFKNTDFDEMRNWIETLPGSQRLKDYRLQVFDLFRYGEDYESIYEFVNGLGGTIV